MLTLFFNQKKEISLVFTCMYGYLAVFWFLYSKKKTIAIYEDVTRNERFFNEDMRVRITSNRRGSSMPMEVIIDVHLFIQIYWNILNIYSNGNTSWMVIMNNKQTHFEFENCHSNLRLTVIISLSQILHSWICWACDKRALNGTPNHRHIAIMAT